MNIYAIQWKLRLPSFLGAKHFILYGLFIGFFLSGPCFAQAQQTEPDLAITVQELEDLAVVMEDETAREQLLSRIRTLIATNKNTQVKLPVESAGARLIAALSENVKATSRQLVALADALRDIPELFASVRDQAANPKTRQLWFDMIIKVALILFAGWAAKWLVRLLLRRPRRALEEQKADTLWVRLPLLAGRTVLDLVPIIAFAAAAYAVLPVVQPTPQVHVVALTLINAYLIVHGILAVARMLLAPAVETLRILPLTDVTANYLFIWVRRLVGFSVYGFFFAEAALLLGLPAGGYTGLLRLLGLVITGLVIVFSLQNRTQVAAWIRGEGKAKRAGRLRDRFADIWHVLAVIYVAAIFGVWMLGIEGGFQYLARATVITAAILIAARLIMTGLDRLVERGFAIRPEIRDRFPTLEERANRYLPAMRLLLHGAVGLIAALTLLETWGVDALGWLDTPLGKQLAESAFSIIAVMVLALIFWEAVNTGVERYLTQTDTEGNVVERSARIRTLLPLFRKVVFTVLAVMVSLIVLSELGIEIGPLLAGAGVVGLAIGFGAQTLVKDVITGLFILVEDTIAVGDYVEVGGHSGTVESLSIRTIQLRDPAGNVHTVPFSEVGTVLNYTKDFSNVVLNIGIAYRENVDEVMKVIEDLGREMAEDQTLGPDIIRPLEVQGLQSLDDSAVVIRARIRVKAGTQWGMKREFNRRMKNRFDELGIEIPFPQRTITFGEDKEGNAVAGRIVVEDKQASDHPSSQPASEGKARIVQDKGDVSDGDGSD
ncbi:MAG: mechanosensitive ion channel [Deltaproteobacteria bacterium]|nr:mechanosensitive ion channel [Deltaproteobacteria bacterium]